MAEKIIKSFAEIEALSNTELSAYAEEVKKDLILCQDERLVMHLIDIDHILEERGILTSTTANQNLLEGDSC